jgi:hypothetical protein
LGRRLEAQEGPSDPASGADCVREQDQAAGRGPPCTSR